MYFSTKKDQRNQIANLIRDFNESGENRQIAKKLGDIPSLVKLLNQDLEFYQTFIQHLKD